jgi:membrane protein DedA with SNARE-associated domain
MVPVPSLLVMPFAGFLASQGQFSLPLILAINSAGALVGSAISYWIGMAGGKPLLERYGRYLLIRPEDLAKTERFFAEHGAWTIFIARFIPVVRHLISIPAGIARMKFPVFLFQTFLGASAWGGGLMVLGYILGTQWEAVVKVAKRIDLLIAVAIVLALAALAVRFVMRRRREERAE